MIAAARSRAPAYPAPPTQIPPPPLLVSEPYRPELLQKRQDVAPDNPDYPECNNVPNYQLSCWPTTDIAVLQNKWYHFVWNSRYITFVQRGMVDVYLYQADSNLPVANWTRKWTADGWLSFQVTDDWWGTRGLDWQPGKNQTLPFYFIVVESGHEFVGGEPKEPTFFAIQTGPVAAAVSASLSSVRSASIASSSHSAALASSTATGGAANSPALQNGASDQSFPAWAIALLVVLGVLALVSILLLTFLLLRSARRKRAKARRRHSQRSSMGSASPMMAGIAPQSPVATTAGGGTLPGVRQSGTTTSHHHDAASSTSHAHSTDLPPISANDAEFVANVFRRGLRNPDFSGRPIEEGESPEQKEPQPGSTEGDERLTRELAEEGTGLRSINSERGVRVQTLSDEEGTVLPAR